MRRVLAVLPCIIAELVVNVPDAFADTMAPCIRAATHVGSASADRIRWDTRILFDSGCEDVEPRIARLAYPLPLGSNVEAMPEGVETIWKSDAIVGFRIPSASMPGWLSAIIVTTPASFEMPLVHLTPPLLEERPQIVDVSVRNRVFRPSAQYEPRSTLHGIEIGRVAETSHAKFRELIAYARSGGVRVSPTTLLVQPDMRTVSMGGLDGTFAPRTAPRLLLAVAGAASCTALTTLWMTFRRLVRRVRLERAVAILRADNERHWPAIETRG